MKKRWTLLLALLLLGCVFTVAQAEGIAYTHPTLGYTLQYPSDWIVEAAELPAAEGEAQSVIPEADVVLFLHPETGVNVNVASMKLDPPLDADSFVMMMYPVLKTQLEQMFPGCQVADIRPILCIGEKEYYCCSSLICPVENGNVYIMQFCTLDSERVYTITITCAENVINAVDSNDLMMIVGTFTPAA